MSNDADYRGQRDRSDRGPSRGDGRADADRAEQVGASRTDPKWQLSNTIAYEYAGYTESVTDPVTFIHTLH